MTAKAAGDAIPPGCAVIEVQVAELRQLFNSIDPSPFQERDLDPRAEEFIVGQSRDLATDAPSRCWCTSTVPRVGLTKRRSSARQSTSSSPGRRTRPGDASGNCFATGG